MESLTKGLLATAAAVAVTGVLAVRSRRAQAAADASAVEASTAQTRPLPGRLEDATADVRAAIVGTAQTQLAAFGTNVTDNFSVLGPSTRAAFEAWRAAHPAAGPGDVGVIASIDDTFRAGHGMPAVTTAPLGR